MLTLPQLAVSASKSGPKRWLQHRPALTNAKGTFAMAERQLPSPDVLRKLLAYDPETGAFTWMPRSGAPRQWNTRYAGTAAFKQLRQDGYLSGCIGDQTILAHRVAWAIYHGEWPEQIDHINGDKADNRIANLRSVPNDENRRNMSRPKNNKSGHIGVNWCASRQAWEVSIGIDGKQVQLGRFKQKDAAVAARKEAEAVHGYHANHGRARLTNAGTMKEGDE